MQGAEMITLTCPWWAWLLFVFFVVPVIQMAEWCGDKLGHVSYRWWSKWRDRRLTEWSRRG